MYGKFIKPFILLSCITIGLYILYERTSNRSKFIRGKEVIAFKKCKMYNGVQVTIKLLVLENSIRIPIHYLNIYKIDCAKVLSITDEQNNQYDECKSIDITNTLVFKQNEITYAKKHNEYNYLYWYMNNTECIEEGDTPGFHVVIDEKDL